MAARAAALSGTVATPDGHVAPNFWPRHTGPEIGERRGVNAAASVYAFAISSIRILQHTTRGDGVSTPEGLTSGIISLKVKRPNPAPSQTPPPPPTISKETHTFSAMFDCSPKCRLRRDMRLALVGWLGGWLTWFNAELSPKRYWSGSRSQEVGEEGDYT